MQMINDWLKKNIVSGLILFVLTGILVYLIQIHDTMVQLPDKWEINQANHDRYDELIHDQITDITQLKIEIGILKAKLP
jgi:hypothetical protein